MNSTIKIGIACFIGGAVGTAVAIAGTPALWWLGLLAGFCGGYISYEFREVLRAIPTACEYAKSGSWTTIKFVFGPHPLLHICLVPAAILPVVFLFSGMLAEGKMVRAMVIFSVLGYLLSLAYVPTVMTWGARMLDEMEYHGDNQFIFVTDHLKTYRQAVRWLIAGIVLPAKAVVTFIFLHAPPLIVRFAWKLVKLIHSDKRMLCGINAAIGVGVAFTMLVTPEMALYQLLVVIASGGLIGATFGMLSYEVVSKRIFGFNGEPVEID